ncbi:MAG: hypothetical protein IK088_00885, partial [Lachnospiraceae bacterium]|nr:hypothetical protein [Lachnospiraceae bacterium]
MSITFPGLNELFDELMPALPSSAAGPIIAVSLVIFICSTVIAYGILIARAVIQYAATWKMFRAAGERGWKCLIPFYGTYVQYRLVWSTTAFWVTVILAASVTILSMIATMMTVISAAPWIEMIMNSLSRGSMPGSFFAISPGTAVAVLIIWIIVLLLWIAIAVLSILFCYHLSKSYNHGFGYFCGLLFSMTSSISSSVLIRASCIP